MLDSAYREVGGSDQDDGDTDDDEDEDGDDGDVISSIQGLLQARHCSGCFVHINSILTTTM